MLFLVFSVDSSTFFDILSRLLLLLRSTSSLCLMFISMTKLVKHFCPTYYLEVNHKRAIKVLIFLLLAFPTVNGLVWILFCDFGPESAIYSAFQDFILNGVNISLTDEQTPCLSNHLRVFSGFNYLVIFISIGTIILHKICSENLFIKFLNRLSVPFPISGAVYPITNNLELQTISSSVAPFTSSIPTSPPNAVFNTVLNTIMVSFTSFTALVVLSIFFIPSKILLVFCIHISIFISSTLLPIYWIFNNQSLREFAIRFINILLPHNI